MKKKKIFFMSVSLKTSCDIGFNVLNIIIIFLILLGTCEILLQYEARLLITLISVIDLDNVKSEQGHKMQPLFKIG